MTEPTNLLAIDTSSSTLRVAVTFGGDRLVKSENEIEKSHGQLIMKQIDDLMRSAGLTQSDLHGLVVCLGPGSFTGLRIGLAVAKGIATALEIDVVGVNLFEVAEHRLRSQAEDIRLLFPYRRGEFIAATVRNGEIPQDMVETITEAQLTDKLNGQQVRLVGMNAAHLGPAADVAAEIEILEYDAADLIAIGHDRLTRSGGDNLETLEPCYLKKSQAEIKFDERQRDQ